MDLSTSTALVTGANRGFGRALATELLSRGATVYAGARNPDQVDLPGAKPIALDITDPASVAAAAKATGDVTVLVNNAGSSIGADLLTADRDGSRQARPTTAISIALIGCSPPVRRAAGRLRRPWPGRELPARPADQEEVPPGQPVESAPMLWP